MYLDANEVAARYRVDKVTVWRWVKNPNMGFPQPSYYGDATQGTGFGQTRKGSIARWSTRELAFYDAAQSLILDDDLEDAKQAAVLAALRRRFPALRSEPSALEKQAQAVYDAQHAARVASQVNAGVPRVIAEAQATSQLGWIL